MTLRHSVLSSIKTFSGFRSLCTILLLWQYTTALSNYKHETHWLYRFHDLGCIDFSEAFDFGNPVKQLAALDVLGDQVEVKLVLIELVDSHYVGVVQLLEHLDLIHQALQVLLGHVILPYDLHGAHLPIDLKLHFLYFPIGTFAYGLKYAVFCFNFSFLLKDEDRFVDF